MVNYKHDEGQNSYLFGFSRYRMKIIKHYVNSGAVGGRWYKAGISWKGSKLVVYVNGTKKSRTN